MAVQEHILYVRPDSIGDAILAAPLLPAIKQAFGSPRVTVICQEHIAELYERCPAVDGIVTFIKDKLLKFACRSELAQRLQSLAADTCINSVYSRDRVGDFLSLHSGCPRIIAHAGDATNLPPEMWEQHNARYTQLIASPGAWKPEIDRHRDFLRGLGIEPSPQFGPHVWTDEADARFAEEVFQRPELSGRRVVALFAGVLFDVRAYAHYGTALANICRENNFAIVAVGSADHFAANQQQLDAAGAPHVNLSGKATLRQAAEVLRRCVIGVGAETGVAHMACAVGTPHAIILGGGHFGRFMPYSPLTTAVALPIECYGCNWHCRFSRAHCVADVHSAVLEGAIRMMLTQPPTRPRVVVQDRSLWPHQPGLPRWGIRAGMIDQGGIEFLSAG